MRKRKVAYTLSGHTDTVTSLEISPDNQSLLSYAQDSTVRTWDIRPFAPKDRTIRTYDGAPVGQERNLLKASWDSKGERIAAGGGDQTVSVWDVRSGKLLNKLPGHRGTVNDVRFSPADDPISKFICLLAPSTFDSSPSARHDSSQDRLRRVSSAVLLILCKLKLTWLLIVVSGSSDRTLLVGELSR
jgi:WD40 repeat protein